MCDLVNVEDIHWIPGKGHMVPDSVTDRLQAELSFLHWKFALELVAPVFGEYKFLKNEIWQGVSPNALDWHCDFEEGHNLVFLLYFSDLKDDGALWVKAPNGEPSRLVPRKGMLVMLNNFPGYLHKAETTVAPRIIADFRFKVSRPLEAEGGSGGA